MSDWENFIVNYFITVDDPTEADYKDCFYQMLLEFSDEQTDLVYEALEMVDNPTTWAGEWLDKATVIYLSRQREKLMDEIERGMQ